MLQRRRKIQGTKNADEVRPCILGNGDGGPVPDEWSATRKASERARFEYRMAWQLPLYNPAVALVVFLRGINVGGYRTFRPSILAKKLSQYDVVNVGAVGTFVVRKPGARAKFPH